MSRPLSPRAQEILAELEAEAQCRRPPLREVPPPVETHRAVAPVEARRAGAPSDPAGVLELVDAAAEECRNLQRRLADVADALGEAAEQLRAAPPTPAAVQP